MNQLAAKIEALAGVQVGLETLEKLDAYGRWLRDEAIGAGGLGPGEGERIESRHLLDSVSFARGWQSPPDECWDLGTGVGLPGVPLALIWSTTRMVLVDRSSRRSGLLRRALRILEVEATVLEADIHELSGPLMAIVSRATIPAREFQPILARLLAPEGRAVISAPKGDLPVGYQDLKVTMLDPRRRLLMMQST